MSAPEVLHRAREATRKTTGKYFYRTFWKPTPIDAEPPKLPGLRERLLHWDVPSTLLAEWREHAGDVATGAVLLLGHRWPVLPLSERWHLDPITGKSWPTDIYCHDIDFRHQESLGDVKFVWELGRLQYLHPVAALAFKTNDVALVQLCIDHVESWIDHNRFATGVGWASGIELAFRAISLIFMSSLLGPHFSLTQRLKLWAALEAHGIWIERFPSLYSSANNHRLAEGLGLLVLGSLCPMLPHAARWRDQGWSILCKAAPQLILSDGVGAEQALGYTGVTLEMFLLGLLIARHDNLKVPNCYVERVIAAAHWLRWCTDSAGNCPQIGDDDNAQVIGLYRSAETSTGSVLSCIAAMLNVAQLTPPQWRPHLRHAVFGLPPDPAPAPAGMRVFAAGGYTVARNQVLERDVLTVFDHGELGFLSIAAHGHADALSVWLHLDGQPVLVDAGTFLYHAGNEWREYFRSTKAHNTLRLEESDASVVSGNFNWSHKARARLVHARCDSSSWSVAGEHNGYRSRFGAIHRRCIEMILPKGQIVIRDWLAASRPLRAEINFLLHPDLQAAADGSGGVVICFGETPLIRLTGAGALICEIIGPLEPGGWYSPHFNWKQPTTRIAWRGVLNPGVSQDSTLQIFPPSEVIRGNAEKLATRKTQVS